MASGFLCQSIMKTHANQSIHENNIQIESQNHSKSRPPSRQTMSKNAFPFNPNNRVARLIVIGVLRIISEIGAPWGQLAHLANRKVAAVNTRCCALETMVVNMHVRQFPPSLKQGALRGLLNFLRLS